MLGISSVALSSSLDVCPLPCTPLHLFLRRIRMWSYAAAIAAFVVGKSATMSDEAILAKIDPYVLTEPTVPRGAWWRAGKLLCVPQKVLSVGVLHRRADSCAMVLSNLGLSYTLCRLVPQGGC